MTESIAQRYAPLTTLIAQRLNLALPAEDADIGFCFNTLSKEVDYELDLDCYHAKVAVLAQEALRWGINVRVGSRTGNSCKITLSLPLTEVRENWALAPALLIQRGFYDDPSLDNHQHYKNIAWKHCRNGMRQKFEELRMAGLLQLESPAFLDWFVDQVKSKRSKHLYPSLPDLGE